MENDDMETTNKTGKETVHNPLKIPRTVLMVFAWLAMGIYSEVSGPTLPYLKERVGADFELISRAFVARSVGFFIGAIAGGILCELFKRLIDFWMFIALLMAGVATIFAPFCKGIELLGFLFFIDGIAKGIIAAGSNSYLIQLWEKKASPPIFATHFAYGVGAMIAPLITRTFLPKSVNTEEGAPVNATDGNDIFTYGGEGDLIVIEVTTPAEESNHEEVMIEYPYAIGGALTLAVAIVFFVFFFISFSKKVRKAEETIPTKKIYDIIFPCSCAELTNSMALLVPLIAFFMMPIGAERAYGKFIFSCATKLGMVPTTAAILETAFWASFTVGRGIATLVSQWVPPVYIIIICVVFEVLAGGGLWLSVYAQERHIALWILTCVLGMFMSPLFPAAITWANLYIDMTAMGTVLAFISSAVGAFIFSWLAGALFEYKGPNSLMYLMAGYGGMTLILFIIMFLLSRRMGHRDLNVQNVSINVDEGAAERMLASDDQEQTEESIN